MSFILAGYDSIRPPPACLIPGTMDPYHILGVDHDATPEEIKLAYRRVAMRWHPDRNDNSSESREKFHQAAEAFKILSERAAGRASSGQQAGERYSESSDRSTDGGRRQGESDSRDDFADSVFWDVTLDYAIKLAQSGMNVDDIAASVRRKGCPRKLARVIADKAFYINAHYAEGSSPGGRRGDRPDQSTFKQEKLDAELWRAFIGQRGFVLSARGAVENYLLVFREFRQSNTANPLNWLNLNRRLLQILNFSIVLFATMLVAVHFFPGPSQYKLLADRDLLQLPFLLLPLMLAWMLYRKLWLAGLAFSLFYLATLAYYEQAMPQAPAEDLKATLTVAAVCFAPFVLITLFANFLYYLKSLRTMRRARELFTDHIDQLVWIKNRAGTSAPASILFLLLFVSAAINLAPGYWDISTQGGQGPASQQAANNAAELEKIRRQTDEAEKFFDIAEKHFNAAPPDYIKAEMAYSTAADNGSLLAAYKLGYMYYSGTGAAQDDVLAFSYFRRATLAPLAFQPHDLETTTRFLAESYNNLGIMYQYGIGTARDPREADRMFRRAAKFGAATAERNLELLYQSEDPAGRRQLLYPEF